MENMLENQTDQREVYILISLPFITLFQRARRTRVILLQRLISQSILDYFCVATKTMAQTCSMGSSKYWFETFFHSNALNMWWKENLQVSRETFRPRPHVSGYFLIRNFFFPDTKISASARYVITAYSHRIRPSTGIRIHSGFTEHCQNCPIRHWFVQV